MTSSLRARFALTGLVMTLAVMLTLGGALQGLFERHVERSMEAQLDADLRFLARGLMAGNGAGGLELAPLPDPRFLEPFSGLYWQIRNDRTGEVIRSPSLAGATLTLDADELRAGQVHRHIIRGPEGGKMIALERRMEAVAYRVVVAVDRKVLRAAKSAFLLEFLPVLVGLALVMLVASAAQGMIALHPIGRARQALAELRAGRRERLGGALPSELKGLDTEFDALLGAQRRSTRIARERAADLAHGLRTPLALLDAQARDLQAQGQVVAARDMLAVTTRMEARLSRELARAHIHGPGPFTARIALAPLARLIADALARGPRGEALSWEVSVPENLTLAADEGDLLELLGSILDNATKWASTRVRLVAEASAESSPGGVVLRIEDDGPGIPPIDRRAALSRGVRLAPERSGTGLGLAIAQDIAAAYGGTLALETGEWDGLCVRVTLPGDWESASGSSKRGKPQP